MGISIWQYNESLPRDFQQSNRVISAIAGRQGQFYTAPGVQPSPLLSPELFPEFDAAVDKVKTRDEGLQEMRLKARTKWRGPQGQVCNECAFRETLQSYYNVPRLITPFPTLSPWVKLKLREIFSMARLYAYPIGAGLAAFDAHQTLFNKKNSNSGFTEFTSDPARRGEILSTYARELASDQWRMANFMIPVIVWYRHQRNKYRGVFGDALVNLALAKAVAYFFFEGVPHLISPIAWRSPSMIYGEVLNWVRGKHPRVVEGDYKAMDAHYLLALALWTAREILEAMDRPYSDYAAVEQLLVMFFHQPLIDDHANLITGEHALFSGQYPTNPLECYTNIIAQLLFIERLALILHKKPEDIVFKFFVMGDDSALIIDGIDSVPEDVLKDLFVSVATSLHLEAETSKQRVSSTSMWFCKHGYLLAEEKPGEILRLRGKVYPVYPVDAVFQNCVYPEQGPAIDSRCSDPFAPEIVNILARADDAVADPAFMTLVEFLIRHIGRERIIKAPIIARGYNPNTSWIDAVQGKNIWSPSTSFTYQAVLKGRII